MSSTNTSTTWLVTGANRGIGFEIVRQLLESSSNIVVATCRDLEKATALYDIGKASQGTLYVLKLDIGDFDSVRASASTLEKVLGGTGLDYLINNAGIASVDTAFTLDVEILMSTLRTNAVGPALLSQVCLPFLQKGGTKKILHISSTAGSIATAAHAAPEFQLIASYAMSKAALNMLAYKQKLEQPDFTVITLCPGWVKTGMLYMGGDQAALEPKESIAGILKVITCATTADSGKYLRWNGEEIPW
ncbi:NAD-P-binding protein [Trametes gibbosa]|nr:NAD-P-binding protein [Trametes gibbosa]